LFEVGHRGRSDAERLGGRALRFALQAGTEIEKLEVQSPHVRRRERWRSPHSVHRHNDDDLRKTTTSVNQELMPGGLTFSD
jgi:hypothetical protein